MNSLKILLAGLFMVIILCAVASADQNEANVNIDPIYYRINSQPPDAYLTDPQWIVYHNTAVNIEIAAGSTFWIGVPNDFRGYLFQKDIVIRLEGTNLGNIDNLQTILKSYPQQNTNEDPRFVANKGSSTSGTTLRQFEFFFEPQPEWEAIGFKNSGATAMTITKFYVDSQCYWVSSLTEWGLAVLVLLLIVTGYIMYRRRRSVTA